MQSRRCEDTEASAAHTEGEARPRRRDQVFRRSTDRRSDRHNSRASTNQWNGFSCSARAGRGRGTLPRSSTVMLFRTACPALQITCGCTARSTPQAASPTGRKCLVSLHEDLMVNLRLAQRRRRQEMRRLRPCSGGRLHQRSPEWPELAKNARLDHRHAARHGKLRRRRHASLVYSGYRQC